MFRVDEAASTAAVFLSLASQEPGFNPLNASPHPKLHAGRAASAAMVVVGAYSSQ